MELGEKDGRTNVLSLFKIVLRKILTKGKKTSN